MTDKGQTGDAQVKTYEGFRQAIRDAAENATIRKLKVEDDYEYDSSSLTDGPRKVIQLIGLSANLTITFTLSMSECPSGCVLAMLSSERYLVYDELGGVPPQDLFHDTFGEDKLMLKAMVLAEIKEQGILETEVGLSLLKHDVYMHGWYVSLIPKVNNRATVCVTGTIRLLQL